ncbi:hypothetical protein DSECCO2_553030 [anaerobic digester metagenome]
MLPPAHLTVVELRFYEPSHSPSAPPPMAISPRSTAWGYAEKGWFPDLLPRIRLSTGYRHDSPCPLGRGAMLRRSGA